MLVRCSNFTIKVGDALFTSKSLLHANDSTSLNQENKKQINDTGNIENIILHCAFLMLIGRSILK